MGDFSYLVQISLDMALATYMYALAYQSRRKSSSEDTLKHGFIDP